MENDRALLVEMMKRVPLLGYTISRDEYFYISTERNSLIMSKDGKAHLYYYSNVDDILEELFNYYGRMTLERSGFSLFSGADNEED